MLRYLFAFSNVKNESLPSAYYEMATKDSNCWCRLKKRKKCNTWHGTARDAGNTRMLMRHQLNKNVALIGCKTTTTTKQITKQTPKS